MQALYRHHSPVAVPSAVEYDQNIQHQLGNFPLCQALKEHNMFTFTYIQDVLGYFNLINFSWFHFHRADTVESNRLSQMNHCPH